MILAERIYESSATGQVETLKVAFAEAENSFSLPHAINWRNPQDASRTFKSGREVVARLLIQEGADMSIVDRWNDDTPLIKACHTGRTELVKLLAEQNVLDLNKPTNTEETPLLIACASRNAAMLRALLQQKGLRVNATNRRDETPLSLLAQGDCADMVSSLLRYGGVDINRRDKEGCTALVKACAGYTQRSTVMRLLKETDVDLTATNQYGETALLLCCRNGHLAAVQRMKTHPQFKSVLPMLPKKKSTPLIDACRGGYVEIVDLLLEDADAAFLNEQDHEGCTALYHACKEEHLKVVQALLTNPSLDLNVKNKMGNTALHASIDCRSAVLHALLAKPSLDVNVQNKNGVTPLMKAGGYTCFADFMLLLEHPRVNVNLRNERGNTVLMSAINDRAALLVQLILEVPSLNIHSLTKDGKTALQLAEELGCYDIMEILEEHLATVRGCRTVISSSIACDVCYALRGLV
eukprot:gene31361-37901_t